MKNFPLIDSKTEQEYWVSRSVAAVVLLTAFDSQDNQFVLAVKRGQKTPDPEFIGARCLPCGYLDYDETIREAAARELFEETGIKINPSDLCQVLIDDNPNNDKRQNVVFYYIISITKLLVETLNRLITSEYAEKDEVDFAEFIPVKQIDDYKWAFGHDKIIKILLAIE